MLITPVDFRATLTSKLEQGDLLLPISDIERAELISLLGEDGNYTYLTIRADNVRSEIVKITLQCDTLILERGQDGTVDRAFPRGSCVLFLITPAIIKYFICNYDCCEGECPCREVEVAGFDFPAGSVGSSWTGTVVFSGDLPMEIVADVPSWVETVIGPNYAILRGISTVAGVYPIAVSATNCSGKLIAHSEVVTIS